MRKDESNKTIEELCADLKEAVRTLKKEIEAEHPGLVHIYRSTKKKRTRKKILQHWRNSQ